MFDNSAWLIWLAVALVLGVVRPPRWTSSSSCSPVVRSAAWLWLQSERPSRSRPSWPRRWRSCSSRSSARGSNGGSLRRPPGTRSASPAMSGRVAYVLERIRCTPWLRLLGGGDLECPLDRRRRDRARRGGAHRGHRRGDSRGRATSRAPVALNSPGRRARRPDHRSEAPCPAPSPSSFSSCC